MIYVASPYSASEAGLALARFQAVTKFVLHLIKHGKDPVFSPITYFHPLTEFGALPTDAGFWQDINMQFLRRADELYVLRLPGWDVSKGVTLERRVASILGIPVTHFNPDFSKF